jgi:hypothetical protein
METASYPWSTSNRIAASTIRSRLRGSRTARAGFSGLIGRHGDRLDD